MKPFLKWVGGKTQIIDTVISTFPDEITNYHEPFVGGGSVLLGLLASDKVITGDINASDLNGNLIGLYKNIQNNVDETIEELRRIIRDSPDMGGTDVNRKAETYEEALGSPESYYFWIRKKFNDETNQSAAKSAMFLYLNKTCFRGIYREGPNGFNVPFGNYKRPSIFDEDHLRAVSELIRDVKFHHEPFNESLTRVTDGSFVYLDPPYAPETTSSFVSYTSDGFNIDQHNLLFDTCRSLPARFTMSNADVKLVRDAFPEPQYLTCVISCRRSINSKKPGSKTNEVLISTP